MTTATPDSQVLEQKFGTVFGMFGGFNSAIMAYLGTDLGLYKAMQGAGSLSSAEVAKKLGLSERFVLEWLYQQVAVGIVDHRGDGRFELSLESALLMADETFPLNMAKALGYLPEMFDWAVGASGAFRTGIGRTYDDMGETGARMMDAFFSGWNRSMLTTDALPRIAGVVEVLQRGGKVADVGCGAGAAPIAVGAAFPTAEVHGYDNSVHALAVAEEALRDSGLTNVHFHNPDHDPLPNEPTFDLILTLDCLHDMPRPDLAATAIRQAIRPHGVWFIVDIDGAASPGANLSHPMAPAMFAASVTTCLQSATSTPDGLGLGTLGLPEPKMRELVMNAGFTRFSRVEGLAHPVNAYYEVRP